MGYQTVASNGDRYAVFVNADNKTRKVVLPQAYRYLLGAQVLVDAEQAGVTAIAKPKGVQFTKEGLTIEGLTALVLKVSSKTANPSQQKSQTDNHQTKTPDGSKDLDKSLMTRPKRAKTNQKLPKTGEASSKGLLAAGIALLLLAISLLMKRQKD